MQKMDKQISDLCQKIQIIKKKEMIQQNENNN